MQWKYKAIRWPPLASVAMSGAAMVRIHPPIKPPPAEVPATAPPSSTAATEDVGPPASRPRKRSRHRIAVRRRDLTYAWPVTVSAATRSRASGVASLGHSAGAAEQGGSLNTNVTTAVTGRRRSTWRDLGAQRHPWCWSDGKPLRQRRVGAGTAVT